MIPTASQITNVSIVHLTVCSGADQRKHQSSASLAFVGGIHRLPVNSPHKGRVTRKMFPFDDVIMTYSFNGGIWPYIYSNQNNKHGSSMPDSKFAHSQSRETSLQSNTVSSLIG